MIRSLLKSALAASATLALLLAVQPAGAAVLSVNADAGAAPLLLADSHGKGGEMKEKAQEKKEEHMEEHQEQMEEHGKEMMEKGKEMKKKGEEKKEEAAE